MTELSRLRGSEGYAVRADEAQGSERSFRQQPQALAGNGDERTLRRRRGGVLVSTGMRRSE